MLTVRVDDGHDIDIVVVKRVLDNGVVILIPLNDLIRHVLKRLHRLSPLRESAFALILPALRSIHAREQSRAK